MIEKPIAATAAAVEIAQTAERLGLGAMVGHTFQYNPAVNAVRERAAANSAGVVKFGELAPTGC